MSKTQHTVSAADALERERKVFRYSERYGQHPETEARYGEAIRACESMSNLSLTVAEIARMYEVDPQCLRNQLKRHFPDIIPERNRLRIALGYDHPKGNSGLKKATVNRYAKAVEMLRDPSLTVREVAQRCDVSYQGLQQHLIFYHKDIADARMLARADAVNNDIVIGSLDGSGGVHRPRPEAVERDAPAVEMYRTTDLPATEIAKKCGLSAHNFESYLRKWHKPEMVERRKRREAELKEKREAENNRPDRSGPALARERYTPAIEMLLGGMTLSEAASALGVELSNLGAWMKRHHSDVLEASGNGMMRLQDGKLVTRRRYARFAPVCQYIGEHPSERTENVARRFGVPTSSLMKFAARIFPEQWKRHCEACDTRFRPGCSVNNDER